MLQSTQMENDVALIETPQPITSSNNNKTSNFVELASKLWKDAWYTQFDWIEFNSTLGKVICKTCKEKGGKSVFAKQGLVNIKVSAFQDHARFDEHRRLTWATQSGKKIMEKVIIESNKTCDEAVLVFFKATYFIGKETLSFCKFPGLCKLLLSLNAAITK